jgi:alpha,alpha-trehalase
MIGEKTYKELKKHDIEDAMDYIAHYWHTLKRKNTANNSTLISLPHPYVVPSEGNDHFAFEEQYYWDSYFTALGLDDEDLVTGMLDNLIFMFEEFGLIPNGNRYYFTSRSQPPILTTFIFHVYDKYDKSHKWLKKRIDIAKREYHEVWLSTDHPHKRNVHKGLSRYYDINYLHDLAEAESGWDMTPRFKRQCLDYLPIDLNCLLYKYEKDFERAAEILEEPHEVRVWEYAAGERQKIVDRLMWHKRKVFFFDYNFHEKKQGTVWSLAGYYAMWSGLASKHQAQKLVKNLTRFERKGGLTTTAGNFMYTELFGSTRTQWAYPNGWAPLHFFVIEGLQAYGYEEEAKRIAHKWLKTCNDWYSKNGEFLEKYNVVNPNLRPAEGLYPSQTGFAWTNGMFTYLADKYITDEPS